MILALGLAGAVLKWMWVSAGYAPMIGAAVLVAAYGVLGARFPRQRPGPAPTWQLATWTGANISWMTGLADLVLEPYLGFGLRLLACAPVFILAFLLCTLTVSKQFGELKGDADGQTDAQA